ncbi:hypothetical protein R50073_17420 [Maricurvus nonylphenolicus]|uniref:GNAT family N-acetyltransferase n=1 Tax=Maricurvus nonylphenolicus TaxID=1008307 RepID=UPI0036F37E54
MADITIRPATPEDAHLTAALMYSSGPKAFDYVFANQQPEGSLDFLHWMFMQDKGMFSYRNHWVAEVDGKVLGLIGSFTKSTIDKGMLATSLGTIRYLGLIQGLKALAKGMRFEYQLVKPPKKDCLYIAHVGVTPESRGLGLGSKMIAHVESLAREQGIGKLSLDVSVINPRAQQLYERLSFKVLGEQQSYTPDLDNHRYMEYLLS